MRSTCHTVLIVEDHPPIREFETLAVEDAGYLSVAACDADAALAVLEHEAEVDVVVTDVRMPGSLDGLELARTVRERWPWMGVVIASSEASEIRDSHDPHVRAIRKPFTSEELICAIESVGSAA